ncbi:hypothetical protein Tco_0011917 [Tanacetum coccineum]
MRSHQNESLAIAERNLFDDEASSSNNTGSKLPTPPKTLHKNSRPNSSSFQNPIIFTTEQTGRFVDSRDIWLIQSTCTFQGLRNEDLLYYVKHYLSIVDNIQADGATRDTSRKLDQFTQFRFNSFTKEKEGWNRIEEYIQYQDDQWNEPSPSMNVSSISEAMKHALRGRLKRACNQISFLETPTQEVGLKKPYLICDYCRGSHEADECEQNNLSEQVCLSGGYIYNDPSLLRFYQNDDTSPWGNNKRKEKGEDGPEWIIRSKFEDELANFMLKKKSYTKGIGDMLVQHQAEKNDEVEQLLSIFKQIHINLPFLEAMIHMPKGAKVLKDLLSHKEKLKKAASPVKLSEECSAIIQRSLPQKEGDPGSFTLPCLIRPLANDELCVLTESYEDGWPEKRQHKFFDNVAAVHSEDTMASPPPQKSLRGRVLLATYLSRCTQVGPVSKYMKNGAIELYDEEGSKFIVNKQWVKPYQKNILDINKDDDATLEDEGEVT